MDDNGKRHDQSEDAGAVQTLTNNMARRPIRWRARLRVLPPVSAAFRLPERFADGGAVFGILALATSTALIAAVGGGQTFHHLSAWLGLVRATPPPRLLTAQPVPLRRFRCSPFTLEQIDYQRGTTLGRPMLNLLNFLLPLLVCHLPPLYYGWLDLKGIALGSGSKPHDCYLWSLIQFGRWLYL